MAYATVESNRVIAKIGNVVEAVEVDDVLFTLASDAIVRVNDADTGENIARIAHTSQANAAAAYAVLVAKAKKFSE